MRLANAAVNKDGPRRSRFATPLCLIQLVFSAGFIILWCTSMPHSLLQQIHTDAESHLPSDYILAHHDEVVKDWKSAALCEQRPSLDHIKVMEKVLDPRAFLGELVKQKGQTWVQIGSNTMDSMNGNDPLKKMLGSIPTWNKVFVEPIPQLFAKLEQSIQRWPNSTAINVALSPDREVTETKAPMWCYGAAFNSTRLGKDLPRWANQICSFNASHIGRHFKGKQGVPVEVTAVSLEELLRRNSIRDVQVLVIDTEGFDYAVLKQIPFERFRPAFILWEHKHLYAARKLAEELMRSHCYAVKVLDMENTVAMSLFV